MKRSPPNMRMLAAQAVMAVVDGGHTLERALAAIAPAPATHDSAPQSSAPHSATLQEICFGACRHYHYFDALLACLLKKPLKTHDRVVHFILINACYQLEHMRTPDHAAVSESVAAVKGTRFSWADRLINGVLRRFLETRERLKEKLPAHLEFAFPLWLYESIRSQWGDHLHSVLAASNRKPPLTLRVNSTRISRDEYLAKLAQADIPASPTRDSELGITLATPMPVERVPGFADGLVSVQDEAAQLTLKALTAGGALRPQARVLDGCAAPGGKTCLLLEAQPELAMVAVDLPARVELVRENLTRLGLHAEVIAADLKTAHWWDGRPFDCILLDVPCSGSGIIRRHPDIKHRRKPSDLAALARQQYDLLVKAWSLLVNGGTLLYVTCSILAAENDAVMEQFIAQQPHAQPDAQALAFPGIATRFGKQRLPGVHPGDGFYYCALKNCAPTTNAPTNMAPTKMAPTKMAPIKMKGAQ